MIVNVTEEQKRVIESQGFMVIEYKKWCYDLEPLFKGLGMGVIEFCRKVFLFFEDMARKINKVMISLADSFAEIEMRLKDAFEFIGREDFYIDDRLKYKFVRSIGNIRELHFDNRVIYHRCRDRC